jgi:hypothetical protein
MASSHLFLFGHLKHKLHGCSYDSANEIFAGFMDLMENLEKSFLQCIFDEWISRLHLVVDAGAQSWRVYPNIAK